MLWPPQTWLAPLPFFFFDNLRCSLKEKNTKETTTYRQRQELLVGCLYKQRGFLALRDSFAAAWAATLLFLLTQRNKHPKKLVLKFKILLIILTIDQSGIAFSKARGSIQFFASPSMMMWFQFSWCASWTAQRMVEASATGGGQHIWSLVQTLITLPLLFLVTIVKADDDLENLIS